MEYFGLIVEDDGIGFDKRNRDSFGTLYSEWKVKDGAKGFGRFTCLKYLDKMQIDSVFADGDKLQSRRFKMGVDADIITDEVVGDVSRGAIGSIITTSGIKSVKFPAKGLDIIARRSRMQPDFGALATRPSWFILEV